MDILFIYPAESEGFEPPIRRNAYTAFRVRLFRPLRQLSFKSGCKGTAFFWNMQGFAYFFSPKSLFSFDFVKAGAENAAHISDGDQGVRVYLINQTHDQRALGFAD